VPMSRSKLLSLKSSAQTELLAYMPSIQNVTLGEARFSAFGAFAAPRFCGQVRSSWRIRNVALHSSVQPKDSRPEDPTCCDIPRDSCQSVYEDNASAS